MKQKMRCMGAIPVTLLFVGLTVVFLNSAIAGEDPVTVAPDNYKVLLDNDEIRMLEFKGKAGDKIPVHSHPKHVGYFVHGGKMVFTTGGKTTEMDAKEGQALWVEAGDHSAEVVGPGEVHVIIVEVKK